MVDKERVVPMPQTWFDEETRDRINGHSGPGVFEQYGANLNPNNHERMNKTWSETSVKVSPC